MSTHDTLTGAILETFQVIPRKTAVHFKDRSMTYGQLDAASGRLAQALASLGASKGDRVCLYIPNSIEFVVSYLANLKLELITIPTNILYRETELAHILEDSGAKVIYTHSSNLDVIRKVKRESGRLERTIVIGPGEELGEGEIAFEELMDAFPEGGGLAAPAPQPDDVVGIFYTSGTTGRSKGAALTQKNLISNIRALIGAWRLSENDRILLCLPLFHMHGLHNGLHGALVTGMSVFLHERFYAGPVLESLARDGCTLFYGVPTMYKRLLEAADAEAADQHDLSGMRLFVSGSAPLPAGDLRRFEEAFGHTVLERYGMSETAMNISNPYEGERRPGSIGFPLPGVSIRIVNEDGKDCEDEEVGEIWIKGDNVFKGYWNRPTATRESFTQDGWFKSGDLGKRSGDGYYTIVGRSKDLIISSGFNVYPREIEELILKRGDVVECVVIGVPDPVKGEVIKCYVVPREGKTLTEGDITGYCREKLASFKVPRKVVFLKELPRTPTGKVMKHKLMIQPMNY
ncbi:MAG: AMP-binding protein [Pseudomonadota bacterium]